MELSHDKCAFKNNLVFYIKNNKRVVKYIEAKTNPPKIWKFFYQDLQNVQIMFEELESTKSR